MAVDAPINSSSPSATAPVADGTQEIQVIEPPHGWIGINWGEVWRYRELFYFLIWRDIKVRYKQTALGAAWAVLQPLATMVIFSLFFGRLAGLGEKTGGVPYPVYVYTGLLAWQFFANAIVNSGTSVVGSSNLITKVYFPRLIIPMASVGAGLVDFAISAIVLLGLMFVYGTPITPQLFLLPLFLAGTVLAAMGVGTFLAGVTVAYRDFRHAVPFMVQLWMFVTPVIYPASIVPEKWRWVLSLNPMAGLIEGFRSAFLGVALDWAHIFLSLVIAAVCFAGGVSYFRSVERRFADII